MNQTQVLTQPAGKLSIRVSRERIGAGGGDPIFNRPNPLAADLMGSLLAKNTGTVNGVKPKCTICPTDLASVY